MSAELSKAEIRDLISRVAGPVPLGYPLKTTLASVAHKLGLTERRVRAYWNGEVRAPLEGEISRLRAAAAKAKGAKHGSELRTAADQFELLAARLEAIDPDLYRNQIDGYRALAVGARALDGREGA